MLESLTVENFQHHKKFRIDFDPRVNVLVGASDKGKSSLLRALRWVCTNRPRGTSFINWEADSTRVKLKVDGHRIVREAGKENLYNLDGKKYVAFGADVPTDITSILNVDDLNWSLQHSGPFWFDRTPGQVAQSINSIVNLDLIDRTLGNLASSLRKARAEESVTLDRLKAAEADRDRLEWVERADSGLRAVEESQEKAVSVRQRRDRLALALKTLSDAIAEQKLLQGALAAAETALDAGRRSIEASGRTNRLRELIDGIEAAESEAAELRDAADAAERELWRDAGGKCPVCGSGLKRPKK